MTNQILEILLNFAFVLWLVPIVFVAILLRNLWLARKTHEFISKIEWVTLEVRIPKGNLKSVKSMEQVFASLHGTYSFGIAMMDRLMKGDIEHWISMEIVGTSKGVHFYVHTPKKYRNLVQASFFAQYPDVEIDEVTDYTKRFAAGLPDETYDIFGTDFTLAREDPYPLKTYPYFENIDEEKVIDPIATIAEVVSSLNEDEQIWLQFLIRPVGDEWSKKAGEIIDKLSGKESKKSSGIGDALGEFTKNLARAPFGEPEWGTGGGDEKPAPSPSPTSGKRDFIKAVEGKTSKLAFEGLLRFIYIDSKDAFTSENVDAVMGALRQFAAPGLNSLKPNTTTLTVPKQVSKFPPGKRKELVRARKKELFKNYIRRDMPQEHLPSKLAMKTSVFSVEELATMYHPPASVVTAAKLHILESRKGEPPVDLPLVKR